MKKHEQILDILRKTHGPQIDAMRVDEFRELCNTIISYAKLFDAETAARLVREDLFPIDS
jgi:lysyl-tRNA synthetase class I